MSTRTDYSKTAYMEKRRNLIKNTAKKMIIEQGISRTTMKDIALACDIGRKTLYRFYSNLELLVQDIFFEIISNKENFAYVYTAKGETYPEQLENALLSYCDFWIENKDILLFYYEYDYHFRTVNRDQIHDLWKTRPNVFYEILLKGIENGDFSIPKERAYMISMTMGNTILGLAQKIVIREEVYIREYDYNVDNMKEIARLLVRGVL